VNLRFHDAERSGRSSFHFKLSHKANAHHGFLVDLLMNTSTSSTSTSSQPVSDLEIIERALLSVSDMLERVLTYVRAVLSGEKNGDPAIGRYLMDTLGASTDDLEKGGFNASLQVRVQKILTLKYTHHVLFCTQDTLMISYLANLVRSQAEVSSRLALTAIS
jgi:translation initiation factor 3 subunit F